jgi:hypothetical protein
MTGYGKPVPVADADSAPFWDGCARGELLLQRCADCGAIRFPAAGACPHCRATGAEWITASGRARVYSWIVVTHPVPREIYAADVPYVVALVELEEGVRMATNIVGCDAGEVRADMEVEVTFDEVAPGVVLPRFRPRGGA